MVGSQDAWQDTEARPATVLELFTAVRRSGDPGLSRASLDEALHHPMLSLRLVAAVVAARLGDVTPLMAVLDEVRALGPAARDELGGRREYVRLFDQVPRLPEHVQNRLARRAEDPQAGFEELVLLEVLAAEPGACEGADVDGWFDFRGSCTFGSSQDSPALRPPAADDDLAVGSPAAEDPWARGDRAEDDRTDAAQPVGTAPDAADTDGDGLSPPVPLAAPPPGRPRTRGSSRSERVPTRSSRGGLRGADMVRRALEGLHRGNRSSRGATATTPAARSLQYAVETPDGLRRQHAWVPGAQELVVRIGAPAPGWGAATGAFPEEAVDFAGADGAMLSVTAFVDAGGLGPVQQLQMFLPRQGASSEARVQVDVPPGVREARCSVLIHQGTRLLQSMEVVGPVRDIDRGPGPGLRIVHEVDLVSSPAGLTDRRAPDVGLDLQVGPSGTGVLLREGQAPSVVHLAGIEQLRDTLAHVLLDALEDDDVGAEPGGPEQTELLVRLARQGSLLHRKLEHDLQSVDEADHVQVIASEDEYVPLELVYDYGFPATSARLCRGWRSALQTGRCSCRPREGEVRTVCPLGFWGLRKTLERHSSSGRSLPPGSFSLMGQRTTTGQLRPLTHVLFAASRKVKAVDPDAVSAVEAALRGAPGVTVHHVTNWRAWCRTIDQVHPGMLLALPHNEAVLDGVQELHIGRLSRLELGAVTPKHVGDSEPPPGPIVLLLGCGTGVADIPWQSAAAAFRRAGASVVIGCTVPVLGRQVSRLSQLLVEELERTGEERQTLGTTMLGVRRRLLLEGHSVALALVAFGDADWRLPAMA